jgi:hypothetical protein
MTLVHVPWSRHPEIFEAYAKNGPAYTVFDGGKPIFAAGVSVPWKGFGEAWMLLGVDAKNYPLSLYRHASKMLAAIIADLALHRVQAVIADGQPHLVRWIEKLGFTRECVMRRFGPDGGDYVLYARFD